MATHQSALTPISDFSLSSEVVTMWQTDSTAHKLKPRSFHKSIHLRVHSVDFHPGVNRAWHPSDLQEVEKYVKNMSYTEVDQISSLRLPQSKSYLKIVGIPYLTDQSNTQMSSDNVKRILKNNHIFNDISSHLSLESSRFLRNWICLSFGLTYGICKMALKPKQLLTGDSMLEVQLLLFIEWIWTPVFCSVKTAGNGNIQLVCATFRKLNVLSAIALIKQFIVVILHGATKLTTKLILSD